jgi:hypothetical protein
VLGSSGRVRAQSCPSGSELCGQAHCTPDGGVCCAALGHEEVSCPAGTDCTGDGGCAVPLPCDGGVQTIAGCGGDSCSCSAPCARNEDCISGCCTTAGACAPSCVCAGEGLLFLMCDRSSPGAAGISMPSENGCGFVPFAIAPAGLLVVVLGIAWVALRRVSRY